jgi:hypothetical protein
MLVPGMSLRSSAMALIDGFLGSPTKAVREKQRDDEGAMRAERMAANRAMRKTLAEVDMLLYE